MNSFVLIVELSTFIVMVWFSATSGNRKRDFFNLPLMDIWVVLLLSKFGPTGEVFGSWPDWLSSSRNDYQVTSPRAGLSHYYSQLAWRNLVTNSAGFHSFNSSWSTLRFGTCTRHQSPIDRSGWIPLKACSKVEFQIVIYNDLKRIQS